MGLNLGDKFAVLTHVFGLAEKNIGTKQHGAVEYANEGRQEITIKKVGYKPAPRTVEKTTTFDDGIAVIMKMLSNNPGKAFSEQVLMEVLEKTGLDIVLAWKVVEHVMELATSNDGTRQHGDVKYANEEKRK